MQYSKVKKAAKILDTKYLASNDFNSRVVVRLIDGCKFDISFAFYTKLSNYYVIFTEHHSYWIFEENDVVSIRQYSY